MKKSGLADSPFFTPSTPPPTAPTPSAVEATVLPPLPSTEVFAHENAHLHNRTDVQLHERTTAQSHKRANEQAHKRTDAQPHNRTSVHPHKTAVDDETRGKTRESFDIFQDQNEAIEQLRMRWKKEQGRHVTKGEIMRILLDEILPSKR